MPRRNDLWYDPETGKIWRRAGCDAGNGYRTMWFQGRQEMEHRVAWYLHYGVWPAGYVDHINGNRSDNRIANLRLATGSENLRNRGRPRNNTSGYKGVSLIKKSGLWQASIKFNDRHVSLGHFQTKEDAASAYNRAALRHHGEFARLDL